MQQKVAANLREQTYVVTFLSPKLAKQPCTTLFVSPSPLLPQTKRFGHVPKMAFGKLSLRGKTAVLPSNYSWLFAHLGWLYQKASLWN